MTQSSEGEVEELSGDGETKAKNRNNRDFPPQEKKEKKKRKKQKQKAQWRSPFSLLLNSHPQHSFTPTQERAFFLTPKNQQKGQKENTTQPRKDRFLKKKKSFLA